MISVKVTIKEIPKSNNVYMGRRISPHVYSSKKKSYEALVLQAVKASGWNSPPLNKSRVEICYHFPDDRRRDPDNYSGKFILDGLKNSGVIMDDSFNHIELVLRAGLKSKTNSRVEVYITEIGKVGTL